jgi:hypothetical protein
MGPEAGLEGLHIVLRAGVDPGLAGALPGREDGGPQGDGCGRREHLWSPCDDGPDVANRSVAHLLSAPKAMNGSDWTVSPPLPARTSAASGLSGKRAASANIRVRASGLRSRSCSIMSCISTITGSGLAHSVRTRRAAWTPSSSTRSANPSSFTR